MTKQAKLTHEAFVHAVAELGLASLSSEDKQEAAKAKLTYGAGSKGLRGITYYDRWLADDGEQHAFVEICAQGEENPVQLAGTTLHELGHVLAGYKAGHGKEWKSACAKMGLRRIQAAGTRYQLAMFEPGLRQQIALLIAQLNDGRPKNAVFNQGLAVLKPCGAAIGVRGGKSRGVGSGSRLRKYQCMCGQILRASTDTLDATHNPCNSRFELAK